MNFRKISEGKRVAFVCPRKCRKFLAMSMRLFPCYNFLMTKLFDCTIRDGGHLNGWEFSDECFKATIEAAQNSGVSYFEVGYRSNSCGGKFLRSEDNDMKLLCVENLPLKLVLMLNVRDYCPNLFDESFKSPVQAVRVACHKDEIQSGMNICENLVKLGYEVFLHLMAVSELTEDDFNLLKHWENKNILTSLYFADSYGAFLNSDVEFYYNKLQTLGYAKISFHAHNNLQMAFSNTLKAIELGAFSVDGSAYGMGRGAGNLPMEMLLGHLEKQNPEFNRKFYIDLIKKFYEPMSAKFVWGYNLQNLVGGLKNLHPSKITE